VQIRVKTPEKLVPLLATKKRLKIAVGGRGGAKSWCFADAFVKYCSDGERLCCAREYQNQIDDSVHALICDRADKLKAPVGYDKTRVWSKSGGEIFYRGLSRNPDGIKSMFGVKKMWVEEAQSLSQRTIDILEPTIRETDSELWFSANRGSSKDPFSVHFLRPYEKELSKRGFYEDDDVLIVQINWNDNPFFPEVLERQRVRDLENQPAAWYRHVWEGDYADTVENAIIEPDWFDACVDAHKRLGFEPLGQERMAYDPADTGDAKAVARSHGVVYLDVQSTEDGRIDTATDWATTLATEAGVDTFVWDSDGMGAGLKRQISLAFEGKKVVLGQFSGGAGVDNPDSVYERLDGETKHTRTNKDTFANKRAQYYWMLRDRMFKTWQAVQAHKQGKMMFLSQDELVSFSEGIKELDGLRAELCRIPRKYVPSGRIQILSKPEMKKLEIDSPNMADAVMMCQMPVAVKRKKPARNYPRLSIA